MNTIRCFFILIIASFLSLNAFARVDIKKTKRLYMPVDVSEPILTAESSRKILPKKVDEGESGQNVVKEMLDNTFSFWWNNSPAKNTSVGQIAEKVDKNLKTEVNFGRSEDQKTEHKITLKLLAMQALAKIEYKGWVHADLNYDVKASKAEAEILEALTPTKDLVVSHSVTAAENKSQVSLRWNW